MALFLFVSPALSADVVIVGDTQYKPVAEIVSQIKSSIRTRTSEYALSEIRGKLGAIVENEGAVVVVALGKDAVNEALRLPPSIAVVYGLVIIPPQSSRPNVTGVYMSTPVSDYVNIIRKHLPNLSRLSVIGSKTTMNNLLNNVSGEVQSYHVNSSTEVVDTVNRLGTTHSMLLLPDVNLLSTAVMESVYLFSFRNNIPLLGISEVNVKQGSLFALVFDPKIISRQIGEKVQSLLSNSKDTDVQPSPPRKFNLFINSNTAKKMGIEVPEEMLRKAKKIYQ
jgi:ABC-type uncharacterized transport system substrate-binding protein